MLNKKSLDLFDQFASTAEREIYIYMIRFALSVRCCVFFHVLIIYLYKFIYSNSASTTGE